MDLQSECLVPESVEENEGIANDSDSDKLVNTSQSKVQNNGSCVVEDNNDRNGLNQEGAAATVRKGYGLKKWRRIRRDSNRDGGNSIDTGEMVAPELRPPALNPSKRVQRKQKSEGSVSSTNAVVKSFDGVALFDDSSLGLSPSFAAGGTDSENSEDRSSKSSTAASAPKMKYEIPVIGGFPRSNSKMSSLNGQSSTHPMQFGQQRGKGQTGTSKKARGGERVKIEKENSHSSVESDSRSSNFVFVQGTFSVNNGKGTNEYDGENGEEVQGIGKKVNDEHQGGYVNGGGRGFEDLSPEDVVADSSWADKVKRGENHGPLKDLDPLAESIRALQSAQEALEQEVLKLKEIGNDASVDDPVSELCTESIDVEEKVQETRGEEGSQSFSQVLQSKDVMTELEELFRQKVEAEVEYLTISRTVQKMRVAAVDQISALEEHKAMASEQTQILHKLGDAENKAAVLQKKAEDLEKYCDKIASADEILKMQKRAGKYGLCFLVQLVLLVVFIMSVFEFQFSQDYVGVVPT